MMDKILIKKNKVVLEICALSLSISIKGNSLYN